MEPVAGDTTQLKKALEWELSLDSRDLRSHAWYHGAISRMRAEEIVERDGDFLVRDCTSQPGNYVLTCNCKTQGLHFVINKVVRQPDTVYERVQYQFEDDAYDTVPDLITYYVASGKCITFASGARIASPQNRIYPLSFYVTKYGLFQQHDPSMVSPLASPLATSSSTLRFSPYNSYRSPGQSPPRTKREIPPRLPCKKQRSHSITPAELHSRSFTLQHRPSSADRSNSADGVIQNKLMMTRSFCHDLPHNTHSLPRPSLQYRPEDLHKILGGTKTHGYCEPGLSATLDRKRFVLSEEAKDIDDLSLPDQPPPKPSRVPSHLGVELKDVNAPSNYKRESLCLGNGMPLPEGLCNVGLPQGQCRLQRDSDSGNGSGDSVLSTVTGDNNDLITTVPSHCGVVIKNPRHSQVIVHAIPNSCSTATLSGIEYDSTEAEEQLLCSFPTLPHMDTVFDLEGFTTLLLPTSDNKPLDETAMMGVKMMLQESGSRIIANHLTRVDLEVTVGERLAGLEGDAGLGVSCGMELCALPHGHQLRMDLIERTECLKLLVAVTILTCTSDDDRADILNKWIQVAVDTKSALGNLFGFCGLMMGLCMPQITRLSSTWHVLRQRHTDSAFNYEAKLRPMMKSMHDCTNPQAPNTTIPHLLPFILLQELSYDHLIGSKPSDISATIANCLGSWDTASDFGLSSLFAHMEHARKFTASLPTFRRNAEIIAGDLKGDVLLSDAFRTEFHLKFLWGSRGATVAMTDRHAKFDQVLKVMSEKCEPPPSVQTEKTH